jgi:hypothetical protein
MKPPTIKLAPSGIRETASSTVVVCIVRPRFVTSSHLPSRLFMGSKTISQQDPAFSVCGIHTRPGPPRPLLVLADDVDEPAQREADGSVASR